MDKLLSALKGQRICYYPAAGKDYSDIICVRMENLQSEWRQNYVAPSLYLHVDYFPGGNKSTFQPGQVLHDNPKGKITVKTVQQITTVDFPLSNGAIADAPVRSADYGKCFLMDIEVDFKKGKKTEQTKLLYCFAEGEAFTANVLGANKIELFYLCLSGNVHPFCGVKARSAWLAESLELSKAKSAISKITFCYDPMLVTYLQAKKQAGRL